MVAICLFSSADILLPVYGSRQTDYLARCISDKVVHIILLLAFYSSTVGVTSPCKRSLIPRSVALVHIIGLAEPMT